MSAVQAFKTPHLRGKGDVPSFIRDPETPVCVIETTAKPKIGLRLHNINIWATTCHNGRQKSVQNDAQYQHVQDATLHSTSIY